MGSCIYATRTPSASLGRHSCLATSENVAMNEAVMESWPPKLPHNTQQVFIETSIIHRLHCNYQWFFSIFYQHMLVLFTVCACLPLCHEFICPRPLSLHPTQLQSAQRGHSISAACNYIRGNTFPKIPWTLHTSTHCLCFL